MERTGIKRRREGEIVAASTLVPEYMATQPFLEGLPLEKLLLLCQTNKEFKRVCGEIIATRVKTEFPGPSALDLGRCATDSNVDDRLRQACIQRMGMKTISARSHHCVALLDDGTVVGWGSEAFDQKTGAACVSGAASVLPDARRYIAVSTSDFHSAGLLDNGDVVQWGLVNGSPYTSFVAARVPILPKGRKYVSVSMSDSHSLALQDDGHVVGWGRDNDGESSGGAAALPEGRRYVVVSAGFQFSLGLLDDGNVVGWGNDNFRQVSNARRALPPDRRCVSISAGYNYALGLLDNGRVITWGNQSRAQRDEFYRGWYSTGGIDWPQSRDTTSGHKQAGADDWAINPSRLMTGARDANKNAGTRKFVAISAGDSHALALLDNGQVVGWGQNDTPSWTLERGTQDGSTTGSAKTLSEAGATRYLSISAGSTNDDSGHGVSMGLTDNGRIVMWGNDYYRMRDKIVSPVEGRHFV